MPDSQPPSRPVSGAPPSRPVSGAPPSRPLSSAPGSIPRHPSEPVNFPEEQEGSEVELLPPPPQRMSVVNSEDANEVSTLLSDSEANQDGEDQERKKQNRKSVLDPTVSILTELSDRDVDGDLLDVHNYPNKGFTRTIRQRLEVPQKMLKRVLFEGEVVEGEFDYYYPTPVIMKSLATHIKLTVFTLGLYLIYQLFLIIERAITRCFGIEGSATAAHRGKMVVTSKGRLIFWQLKARQWRWFGLDGRAHYTVGDVTSIMSVSDIRETTVRFSRDAAIGCCCLESKTSLEVIFNSFPYDRSEYSKYFYTSPAQEFISVVRHASGAFKSFYNLNVFGSGKRSKNTVSTMPCAQAMVIRLVSKVGDDCNTGIDHGLQSFESILELNERFTKLLNKEEAFNGPRATQKDIETCDGVDDFKIIGETGNVTIPTKYMPLSPGERVLSTVGQKYETSTSDIVKCVLTFGLFYWFKLSKKKQEHTAHVLTNHRVVELFVQAADGYVPNSLSRQVKIRIRSIFPGKVVSGYVHNTGKVLTSAILSTAGKLCLVLPMKVESAFFAQAMQSVNSRKLVSIDASSVPELAASEADRAGWGNNPSELLGHCSDLPMDVCQLLPLIEGEKAIHYFDSGSKCSGSSDGGRLIITNRTVMRINRLPGAKVNGKALDHESLSVPSAKFGMNVKGIDPYFLLWLPIMDVNGQHCEIKSKGAHPVNFCCSFCCYECNTHAEDSFHFRIQSKMGFTLPIFASYKSTNSSLNCSSKSDVDAPYLKDKDLSTLCRVVGLIANTNDVLPDEAV